MKEGRPEECKKPALNRRVFFARLACLSALVWLQAIPFFSWISSALASVKRIILPKGTRREDLINRNPAELDPQNLEITPLKDFGTMGLSDHKAERESWKLIVEGEVRRTLSLSYRDILEMPSMEKKVLLICPGFFANYGLWKGVSLRHLLAKALAHDILTHVTISGPESPFMKTERFEIKEVMEERVFLAYSVNGESLPEKHGYPLRLVAEGHYGFTWIKYVDRVRAEIIAG